MMNWRLVQDVPYLSTNAGWLQPGQIQVIYKYRHALPFIFYLYLKIHYIFD